jgi:hypothetical protein
MQHLRDQSLDPSMESLGAYTTMDCEYKPDQHVSSDGASITSVGNAARESGLTAARLDRDRRTTPERYDNLTVLKPNPGAV